MLTCLITLTFVTVSAVVKLWGRIRGGWSEYAC
jgi:hypothetical protein